MSKDDAAAYLKIAADLRADIQSGQYAPDEKLPSATKLMAAYNVSRMVANMAFNILKTERLVVGRSGSGMYVADPKPLIRRIPSPGNRPTSGTTSPFAFDTQTNGRNPRWDHVSDQVPATPEIAERLHIQAGDPVIRTRYVFHDDEEPVMISTSWEPLARTAGTPIQWPEDGPIVGVVARMDSIGQHIDLVVENVSRGPATREDAETLQLPGQGTEVWYIERTYTVDGQPVETADIRLHPRWRLEYHVPIS